MTQNFPRTSPQGARVELYRERCVLKILKLSSEVTECKPLVAVGEFSGTGGERPLPDGKVSADTACHVIIHTLDPLFLSRMTSDDVASIILQALQCLPRHHPHFRPSILELNDIQ